MKFVPPFASSSTLLKVASIFHFVGSNGPVVVDATPWPMLKVNSPNSFVVTECVSL